MFHSKFPVVLFVWTTICCISDGKTMSHVEDGYDNNLALSVFFYQQSTYPRDCQEVQEQCSSLNTRGVFIIKPDGYLEPFEVYCDTSNKSDGWTVIQRRVDGSINFNRDWESFKLGFGFLSQEFWIGNEKLSFLTNQKKYHLVVEMTTSNGSLISFAYSSFRMGDLFSNYTLMSLGQFSGSTEGITFCPTNMVFTNCSNVCQRTCGEPTSCQDVSCTDEEACVCPDGFFLQGSDCVPQEECGCYESVEQTIIPEGEFYVGTGCVRRALCTNGSLDWDDGYSCTDGTVCEVRDNIRQCYCPEGYRRDGETCTILIKRDCQEIYEDGDTDNGVYIIQPTGWTGLPFDVYCNMSDGGGWTVFQRRLDGSQDFHLEWNSYKEGFGNLNNDFWLGNDKLYYLTNQKRNEIRIDFVNQYGAPYYAKFDYFCINDESDNYRLSAVGTYSGTADTRDSPDGHQLNYHLNYEFSTKDRDHDAYSSNCADHYRGGWWYNSCCNSCLNTHFGYAALLWYDLPGGRHYIKFTEMKIRPI